MDLWRFYSLKNFCSSGKSFLKCRSQSWFLATGALNITSIGFRSMNNIMNYILAPLSKHMIYGGIRFIFNFVEKIGNFSSRRKISTISFLVISEFTAYYWPLVRHWPRVMVNRLHFNAMVNLVQFLFTPWA